MFGKACVLAMALLGWASTAQSAQIVATIHGDWNDHPDWSGWTAEVRYDTAGLIAEAPDFGSGVVYRWNASMGTPSPVEYFKGTFQGYESCAFGYPFPKTDRCWDETGENLIPRTDKVVSVDFRDFDEFVIDRTVAFTGVETYYHYGFRAKGPGWALDMRNYTTDGDGIETALSFSNWGDYGGISGTGDVSLDNSWLHTHGTFSIARAPVPEPATWALLILGFGAAGAILRRRRPLIA